MTSSTETHQLSLANRSFAPLAGAKPWMWLLGWWQALTATIDRVNARTLASGYCVIDAIRNVEGPSIVLLPGRFVWMGGDCHAL